MTCLDEEVSLIIFLFFLQTKLELQVKSFCGSLKTSFFDFGLPSD